MSKALSALLLSTFLFSFLACQKNTSPDEQAPASVVLPDPLFALLPASKTGIDFSNNLTEGLNTNLLMYEYFYNGGGVAVGDLNGDGLPDIYFTGNMVPNKLYLNQGNMQFSDITAQAGVAGRDGPWTTGVTMADVNGDGLLDIYVCYSGKLPPQKRENQLFINQGPDADGVPRFTEQAEQYGLASSSNSTQAVFFDYDLDGDLDMFLLNHSPESLPLRDEVSTAEELKTEDPQRGVRFFRNDKGKFQDVTRQAGFHSSSLTYGLGAGVADINGDGWPDIYISNDYDIPDYLYINNQNGTFTDRLKQSIGHVSHFSMGNDIADINNDGLPDIYTLDMLPEDNRRQKLLFAPDNYEKFDLNLRNGFHYQYMRNMLQLNNGDGTFSEVGQLAGISNTDWSWAPLFADYDNDGWKDLFVTNGFVRDYTNMDFIKYMGDFVQQKGGGMVREHVLDLVQQMPASNVTNYLFRNNGDLTFSSKGREWGLSAASNSNGAAYADLDGDGALDLVVNNLNAPASVYHNRASGQLGHHYLQLRLEGSGQNTQGVGAKVSLWAGGLQQHLEQNPSRGYQSSVSPVLHFGLGRAASADSLRVVWPGGRQQVLRAVEANQVLTLRQEEATGPYRAPRPAAPALEEARAPIAFTHQKNNTNDFKRQPLLVSPLSFSGPCLVRADVNGDGLPDVYVGGASGQPGALYLQGKNGSFALRPNPAFGLDQMSEDVDALFFDADGDGHLDLYVVSGGYGDFLPQDPLLQDRLYLGDGRGGFRRSEGALPAMLTSGSCARAADLNGDGHLDLFVGGRVVPGRWPEAPRSQVLLNDGRGRFRDATSTVAPGLERLGMVTDAAFADLDGDGRQELVVVGEWLPVTVLRQEGGRLTDVTDSFFEKKQSGWWNKLLVADLDGDGRPELVVGNQGLNTQVRATATQPAELHYKDFDGNGSVDPVLSFYIQGKSHPYVTRDELLDQLSVMRTRFPDYKSFAEAGLREIFTPEELQGAGHLRATQLRTTLYLNDGRGKLREGALPLEAQLAPVHALLAADVDGDGRPDLVLAGNEGRARLRLGRSDANHGVLLRGDGQGGFAYVPQRESGLRLQGDVRSVVQVGELLLFGMNQGPVKAYRVKKPAAPAAVAKVNKR